MTSWTNQHRGSLFQGHLPVKEFCGESVVGPQQTVQVDFASSLGATCIASRHRFEQAGKAETGTEPPVPEK
ncbi:MAG: hypothetical protein CMJ81_01680 [Planctomycetaceae bacterium]|nr:hypothetical protein [Planctomycetaceae bacterium]MBP63795.1 hypothetical protein [Planctomycetaceae bacterium]